jgi:hypothetical protein
MDVELQPDKLVRWKAYKKEGVEEWAGNEVAFSLSADEKQCFVHFSHSCWRRDSRISVIVQQNGLFLC